MLLHEIIPATQFNFTTQCNKVLHENINAIKFNFIYMAQFTTNNIFHTRVCKNAFAFLRPDFTISERHRKCLFFFFQIKQDSFYQRE